MNVGVVGTRTFTNYNLLKTELDKINNIDLIVSGGATGTDKLAERYASEHNIPIKVFKADWNKYGKAAGSIRNKKIINNSNYVIAFWNGKSRGTLNSINLTKQILGMRKIKIIKI
jgi:hypothetical protein